MHFFESTLGVNVVHAEQFFHFFNAVFGEGHRALFFIEIVVRVLIEQAHKLIILLILFSRFLGRGGNDERGARLVDQNGIHFVDNGKIKFPLHERLETRRHIVAQIIEAKLVVRSVGDVRRVGRFFFVAILSVNHHARRQSQKVIEPSHPLAVTLGEVVVHRHHVHAFSAERVQIHRQSTNERFSFSRFHFRDTSFVEDHASDELHVKRDHVPFVVKAAHSPIFTLKVTTGVFQKSIGFG